MKKHERWLRPTQDWNGNRPRLVLLKRTGLKDEHLIIAARLRVEQEIIHVLPAPRGELNEMVRGQEGTEQVGHPSDSRDWEWL